MPVKKKAGCLKMGCAVLAGLFVIGLIASLLGDRNKSSETSSTTTVATSTKSGTSTPAAAADPEPTSRWSYSQDQDAMAGKPSYEASVRSTNTVNFQFPYAGEQHGTLILRTHPRFGKNVIFTIEKGQIQCPSYRGCNVLVRFDEGKAQSFGAAGPEDNSSETIFIKDYSEFVSKMMKAKTVRISPSIYKEGSPIFEFDVREFDKSKYTPK